MVFMMVFVSKGNIRFKIALLSHSIYSLHERCYVGQSVHFTSRMETQDMGSGLHKNPSLRCHFHRPAPSSAPFHRDVSLSYLLAQPY